MTQLGDLSLSSMESKVGKLHDCATMVDMEMVKWELVLRCNSNDVACGDATTLVACVAYPVFNKPQDRFFSCCPNVMSIGFSGLDAYVEVDLFGIIDIIL